MKKLSLLALAFALVFAIAFQKENPFRSSSIGSVSVAPLEHGYATYDELPFQFLDAQSSKPIAGAQIDVTVMCGVPLKASHAITDDQGYATISYSNGGPSVIGPTVVRVQTKNHIPHSIILSRDNPTIRLNDSELVLSESKP